jgi:hypothetical protein
MRVILFLGVLLAGAVFVPTARAQWAIPYRRTIDYIPNRPREFTGRYVRINVTFAGGQPGSPLGRSSTSLGVQSTINPGVGSGPASGASSVTGGGNDLAGVGAGRAALRGPALRTAGFGRTFRFSR